MTVNLDKKITDVSSALCNVTGYKKEELIGKTPSIFKSGKMDDKVYKDLWNKISSGFVWSGELQNRTKEGEIYWLKTNILPNLSIKNDIVESYTSLSEDITDKKQIEVISQTDKLTQLYNRVKLDESLEYEMNRFIRHSDIFSIILIDMDKFKSVNDNYGHQVGDSVLIKLSEILKTHSRKIDIVGRWGGEEFMIICIDTDIKGATHFAENLRIAVEEYVFDVVKHKTISVGVTEVKRTDNIETLIKRVDDYLYEAKESGRNRVISDIKS
jgi:diguanylate cyclase (GGDEF)-like protein/PAS domain S-box-containing protein